MSLQEPSIPDLCRSDLCCGCASCSNICPHNAISMTFDSEGFLAPSIDQEKCVGCKRCEKVCPILNPPKLERIIKPKVYACWNNKSEIRLESSSGGMFSVYAEHIISEGGVVFGAVYDKSMKVVLAKAESVEDLARMRSSKYVQAEVGSIYRTVKSELKTGRHVLFVGTPCQVGGLYGYLGADYVNLYTCDLICHGTPTPVLYEKWLRYLESRLGGKVVSLNMRNKQGKWLHPMITVVVDSSPAKSFVMKWTGNSLTGYLGRMFANNICLRSSCTHCSFAQVPRTGDITLGDFWGIGKEIPFDRPLDEGISLNIVNSRKGVQLVDKCRKEAEWVERTLEEAKAKNPNLYTSSWSHPKRDEFLRDACSLDYRTLTRKYRKTLEGTFLMKVRCRVRVIISRIISLPLHLVRNKRNSPKDIA